MSDAFENIVGGDIGSLEVRGQSFKIRVTGNGRFLADPGAGQVNISADTLEALRARLLEETKRRAVKLAIPAVLDENRPGAAPRRVTLTGIHASNRDLLWREADGTPNREASYNARWMQPLSPQEFQELTDLVGAFEEARQALDAFRGEHSLDARAVLRERLADAMAGAS
ncbi:MAG: hypothetical protein M3O87_04130 [Candidatus Dormibacteraeota bacterium]|nr:hypothetical protein [Candidatus Dormibacteraeota bacterium]